MESTALRARCCGPIFSAFIGVAPGSDALLRSDAAGVRDEQAGQKVGEGALRRLWQDTPDRRSGRRRRSARQGEVELPVRPAGPATRVLHGDLHEARETLAPPSRSPCWRAGRARPSARTTWRLGCPVDRPPL